MERVREGSEWASVDNDGLVVFLYDGSHADVIRDSGAAILEAFDREATQDARWRALATRGLLVAYELPQDDELEIEVIVGSDLDPTERRKVAGHSRSPDAWLWLPSGRLFIDGYNTLRAGHEELEDEGATIEVSPGHYSAGVYRSSVWEEDVLHPQDVLVLQPLDDEPSDTGAYWLPVNPTP